MAAAEAEAADGAPSKKPKSEPGNQNELPVPDGRGWETRHTDKYAYPYIYIYLFIYLFIYSIFNQANAHTCIHTYTHAYIHTYIHTYIHIYIVVCAYIPCIQICKLK